MDDQTQITYIGKVDYRNKMTKFGIKPRDRTKHMYIIGKTGTGKSTFLENMIVQDIQNGHGVAFIDPHGGSADKLLDYIPDWRINDVIYFNPSDMEYPVAFNPLEDPGPEKRHLVTDGLMSVFKKIWPEAFSGRMEYILNMTMMALMEYPDSTVLSINRMLTDKDFRKRVVAGVTDTAVRNAWDELMKWDDKRWSEAIGALVNKVGQFSTNPVIRNIIGQTKSTFDFRKAMDERKIIIINLSKGMIGEQNAPLLGAMLITKIYLSAMSRAELPAHVIERMPPFYFYVDEFQNFANESFASILSEARKYKLCLTVANQFIAQMEETIRDAVFGNMGTTVSFRVGPLDAEFMERVFAPVFTQEDLQNIAFGQYYLTLQIDNMGSKPFSAQGLPPIPPLQTSMKTQVIEASRRNYAASREIVEAQVKEFFGYNKKNTIHSEQITDEDGEILVRPSSAKSDVRMSGGTGIYIKPANAAPKPIAGPKAIIAEVKPAAPKQQIFVTRPVAAAAPASPAPAPTPVAAPVPVVVPAAPVAVPTPIPEPVLEAVPQPLPTITGYRDDAPEFSQVSDRVTEMAEATTAETSAEEVDISDSLSDSLSMLLNRLDNAVVTDAPALVNSVPAKPVAPKAESANPQFTKSQFKPQQQTKTAPAQAQKPAQKPVPQNAKKPGFQNTGDKNAQRPASASANTVKPAQTTQINQSAQSPRPAQSKPKFDGAKKLDRAATTEQKSALQDVLARAMAQAAAKAPEKALEKTSERVSPVAATPIVAAPVVVSEEARKAPELITVTPSNPQPTEPLPTAWQEEAQTESAQSVESVESAVPVAEVAPVPPIPTQSAPVASAPEVSIPTTPPAPTPSIPSPVTAPQVQPVTNTSRTIKEVPEDILRRVLE